MRRWNGERNGVLLLVLALALGLVACGGGAAENSPQRVAAAVADAVVAEDYRAALDWFVEAPAWDSATLGQQRQALVDRYGMLNGASVQETLLEEPYTDEQDRTMVVVAVVWHLAETDVQEGWLVQQTADGWRVYNSTFDWVPGNLDNSTFVPQAAAQEPAQEPATATPPTLPQRPVPTQPAPTPESTPTPSTNVLAFATGFSASDGDILLTRLDGTSPITLTTHPARDSVPVWSPDGTRIAFTSYRDGGRSVYLMHQDGSGVTPIWHGQGGSWSPDSSRLVFVYNAGGISSHLRQWSTTGITTLLQHDHSIALPQWSPDGSQILFTTYEENAWVWLVDSDGRNAAKLIKGQRPAWSPDGSFIAFRGEGADIALIKPDGSCHTVLTGDLFWSDEPAWSPDGQQIAFVSSEQGAIASQLFVMNVDGSQRRHLTTGEARRSAPTWSPDGRYLAYVQKHIVQNRWTVYVLDMHDPSAEPQAIGLGSQPDWQPQP